MALPKTVRTPRLTELEAKLLAAPASMKDWPQPTKDDITLVGAIVVLYGYVDFNLRRLVDAFDQTGLLPDEWKGRAPKLRAAELAKAVWETPVWAGQQDVDALKTLEELRTVRNLVAHFAMRRFPDDDAFVFVTKNMGDYRRALGYDPEPGVAMTAIVERNEMKKALNHIEHIHNWLAVVTPLFEKQVARMSEAISGITR